VFKKAIITLMGLVIFSAIIIGAFAFSNNNGTINQPSQVLVTSDNALSTTPESFVGYKSTNHHAVSSVKNKILTPQDAQKIAEKYIEAPEATAGIPKLVKEDGKKVYVVPVVDHKQQVGEIHLDAHNGKNLGGCGGVK
jgi:uncharacterized membrane protein YkoI